MHPTWRPTPAQADLLVAALVRDERAVEAWRRWRVAVVDVGIDAASERLLPLASVNLARRLPEDEHLYRGRVAHLRGRFSGILLKRDAAEWARSLAAAGVPMLALKGLALATRYYRDFGTRPMSDIDLLVRSHDVPATLALLHERGFTPIEDIPQTCWPPGPRAKNLGSAAFTHGCGFADARGQQIDIHWAALSTHCAPGSDARFWARAVPMPLPAGTLLSLCPSDELVHIIAHGLRWNHIPSIRWVADAVTLLTCEGAAFDWDLFVDEVDRRGLGIGVAPALAVLAHYDVSIPPRIIEQVRALPATAIDRWRDAHTRWPWHQPKPLGVIAFDALRFVDGLGPVPAARQLASYVVNRLAPDGRWRSVPVQLYGKLRARL